MQQLVEFLEKYKLTYQQIVDKMSITIQIRRNRMLKKFKRLFCLLFVVLLCTGFGAASAASQISVVLDGRTLQFDVHPTIIDGRTMVPMRVIFEELGATVEWDGTTRTVTATSSGLIVRTTVGSRVIDVNGNRITMDVAPVIVDGRTLVPVRFVSEAFGAEVGWDAATRTVLVTSPSQDGSNETGGSRPHTNESESGDLDDFSDGY